MSLFEMIRLDGRKALVTGAGQGIGRACALELARCGADLVLNDRPGSEELLETVEEIRSLGREGWPVEADVFSSDGPESIVRDAMERAGAIDILISNPAYSVRCGFLDYPLDELDRTIEGTFKSGFRLCQAAARQMVNRGRGGKILLISSVQAEMPFEGCAPYGAAKAALNHLTHSMSVELVSHRINVNAIEPGWIDTPNERRIFSDAVINAAGTDLPWGRLGLPEDIGRAAAFLVSDAAEYITGAILPVDGGFRFKDMRANTQPKVVDPE
ncbi:SDR family NAD(P)-dependent oxidoreductase [Rubinisphaera italica]|uniref:2-dehydro-3-deoxy-D-gluconate 5-dehydrogenase n=1 Tax=Rubinisphaera italica TaxID=2527969 RepID=A0A5C5XF61_9PLAN|nr:SDR family oxidoreductase [Rubinisphaera italica]TWT60785.1 2-dehydro-3-deoxy-D-gluconate 5-dehydrogenase [Rubinisphaera italica]